MGLCSLRFREPVSAQAHLTWRRVLQSFDLTSPNLPPNTTQHNRPRVPSCSLCGTAHEVGLRWQEERRKYEERLAAGAAGTGQDEEAGVWLLRDPEQQLTLRYVCGSCGLFLSFASPPEHNTPHTTYHTSHRQRAARRRRVWQRRGDGEGRVVWLRVPLKEALAMRPLVVNPGPAVATAAAAPKEEEEEQEESEPDEALVPLATRMRRRLFLPFVRRSTSPVVPLPPPPADNNQDDEEETGDEEYGRRSSSSFSFSSLFRGSHEQQRRRESEGALSYASFASASPALSPYKHKEDEGEETKEEGGAPPRGAAAAAAEPRAEDADDDGGLVRLHDWSNS